MAILNGFISNWANTISPTQSAYQATALQGWLRVNQADFLERADSLEARAMETHLGGIAGFSKLKHSVKDIKANPISKKERDNVETKILRLMECGAQAQAAVLQRELDMRDKLAELVELPYKLLTKETIETFQRIFFSNLTQDGLRLHVDLLEQYVGNPETGKEKDRIIPDKVLDELEIARDINVFTQFHVLWAERVPDPILLGGIEGCEDYFFIAEWGDDVTFDQISKGKE